MWSGVVSRALQSRKKTSRLGMERDVSMHDRILNFKRKNVGLSDEEQFEKFQKQIGGTNFETFRAHNFSESLSNADINKVAARSDNNLKTISEDMHKSLFNIFRQPSFRRLFALI